MSKPAAHYEVYRDRWGKHHWRLISSNGRIVASSGQGYYNQKACRRAIFQLRDKWVNSKIDRVPGK